MHYNPRFLLELVTTIPAKETGTFVAAAHFNIGTSENGISIRSLDENFKKFLLNKVEKDVPPGNLRVYRLRRPARTEEIIAELEEDHCITFLADIWHLLVADLKLQKATLGRNSILLGNGWPTNFFILDKNGKLQEVSVVWPSGGSWHLGAGDIKTYDTSERANFLYVSR